MLSRVLIILYTIYMFWAMVDQVDFTFEGVEELARDVRIVLVLNVFYTLYAIMNGMTLVWEKASEFVDLFGEVGVALIPFMVFLVMYMFTIFLAFYMFGQHQVGFDYYNEMN